MVLRRHKILIGILTIPFIACGFYTSLLWYETQPTFLKLKNDIGIERKAYDAEIQISMLLFRHHKTFTMKPADFLAREALDFNQSESILKHQLKRLLLAKRLELTFCEEHLLISWLSTVYLGEGEYGLETTAKTLFGKTIAEMTQQEAIAIAALVSAPSQYRLNQDAWEQRQEELFKKIP